MWVCRNSFRLNVCPTCLQVHEQEDRRRRDGRVLHHAGVARERRPQVGFSLSADGPRRLHAGIPWLSEVDAARWHCWHPASDARHQRCQDALSVGVGVQVDLPVGVNSRQRSHLTSMCSMTLCLQFSLSRAQLFDRRHRVIEPE